PVLELLRSAEDDRRDRRWKEQIEAEAHNRALEAARRDADHRDVDAIQANGFADNRRRPGEPRLPVVVRDHDEACRAWRCRFSREQEAAKRWLQAECGEVVAGDE